MGAGGPRKPRPEGNGGDGAPPLAKGARRDAWAAHRRSPHDRRNLVAAARGQAGRERAPAIVRRGPRAERHKCTPDQGLHAGAKPLPYLDTIETSLTKKSG